MNEEGLRKAAILLLSLGEEAAAEIFKHLNRKEVQKLGEAMLAMQDVKRDQVNEVLREFRSEAEARTSLSASSDEYIRNVLNRALGNDKAAYLIDLILQKSDTSGIDALKWMDARGVAELIRNEHPQIIATILVHLEPDHAGEILAEFTERLRNDVLLRVATLDRVQPEALRELNEALSKVLTSGNRAVKTTGGGVKVAAEMLNNLGSALETAALAAVREQDPELAQQIQDEMFVFENLLDVDDRGIQLLLREVQSESLIVALKGTSEELRAKIFKNMSQRAGEMLRDDLESKGPVRVSEVEAEQREILKIVRRLADEGQIALGGKGEESFV